MLVSAVLSDFFDTGAAKRFITHIRINPVRGPLLGTIGTPCIVEAEVPIASLGHHVNLTMKMIRRYFVNRGWTTLEGTDYECSSINAIPAANIRRIVRFQSPDFVALTGCDDWKPRLM